MSNHRLVYSTGAGRVCPNCGLPEPRCSCKRKPLREALHAVASDGIVRIRRETQGRKGKTVSVVQGLPLDESALDELARSLKQHCGTGGTVKEGTIIIQGDHRERLREELARRGYTVKLAGG
jgi:translation initiation factor 1